MSFYVNAYYGTIQLNDPALGAVCTNGAHIVTISGGAGDSVAIKRGDCSGGGMADCLAIAQRVSFSPWSWTFSLSDYNAC